MTPSQVLLAAVAEFLQHEVQSELDGVTGYKNRIATNLLKQLSRENNLARQVGEVESLLATQLGLESPVSSAQLTRDLRDDKLALDSNLRNILRQRTMLQMAIDNPGYSAYREALARWPQLASQIAPRSDNQE